MSVHSTNQEELDELKKKLVRWRRDELLKSPKSLARLDALRAADGFAIDSIRALESNPQFSNLYQAALYVLAKYETVTPQHKAELHEIALSNAQKNKIKRQLIDSFMAEGADKQLASILVQFMTWLVKHAKVPYDHSNTSVTALWQQSQDDNTNLADALQQHLDELGITRHCRAIYRLRELIATRDKVNVIEISIQAPTTLTDGEQLTGYLLGFRQYLDAFFATNRNRDKLDGARVSIRFVKHDETGEVKDQVTLTYAWNAAMHRLEPTVMTTT